MGIHRLSNLPSSTPPSATHASGGGWFSPSVVSNSLQLHGLQHARLPCPVLEKPVSITLMHPGSNMHKLGFCLK